MKTLSQDRLLAILAWVVIILIAGPVGGAVWLGPEHERWPGRLLPLEQQQRRLHLHDRAGERKLDDQHGPEQRHLQGLHLPEQRQRQRQLLQWLL